MADREIFVNARGQDDNVGDSALRRHYLDALRSYGPLHVLASEQSPEYISGLGLHGSDLVYTSRVRWQAKLLAKATRGNAHLATNAGEIQGSTQSSFNRKVISQSVSMIHRSGGVVVGAGIGVRAGSTISEDYLHQLRQLDYLAFRDGPSQRLVGFGEVRPDWAFAAHHADADLETGGRSVIAVAMRSDRLAPDEAWFNAVRRLSTDLDARIVVAVQVRRDERRAVEIASELGAQVAFWPAARSHVDHEKELIELYTSCAAIVSDRLHGLIMGATAGAAPIGLSTETPEKLDRTFEGAGLAPVGAAARDIADETSKLMAQVGEFRRNGPEHLSKARSCLRQLGSQIGGLLK